MELDYTRQSSMASFTLSICICSVFEWAVEICSNRKERNVKNRTLVELVCEFSAYIDFTFAHFGKIYSTPPKEGEITDLKTRHYNGKGKRAESLHIRGSAKWIVERRVGGA